MAAAPAPHEPNEDAFDGAPELLAAPEHGCSVKRVGAFLRLRCELGTLVDAQTTRGEAVGGRFDIDRDGTYLDWVVEERDMKANAYWFPEGRFELAKRKDGKRAWHQTGKWEPGALERTQRAMACCRETHNKHRECYGVGVPSAASACAAQDCAALSACLQSQLSAR